MSGKIVNMVRVRFGLFDFNPNTGELFREGHIVHLPAQPAKVLAVLISAKGELVTRQSLREALWPDGISVEFDRSLNFAMAQLRTALGDSAEAPIFIRTLPKRGYQFLAPISEQPGDPPIAVPQVKRRSILWLASAGGVVAAALAGIAGALWASRAHEPRIAVARFQNETGNPALDRFADTITDSLIAGITARTAGRYGVIGNAAILRRARNFQNLSEIASELKAQYAVIGQIQQDGPRVRVLAHLIRLPEQTHLIVSRIEIGERVSESQLAAHVINDFSKPLALPTRVTD